MRYQIAVIAIFALAYMLGEYWFAEHIKNTLAQREAHNFDRALIISGTQALKSPSVSDPSHGSESEALIRDSSLVSARARHWIEGKPYVESIHTWSIQVWDLTAGSISVPSLSVYGVDSDAVDTFRLGKSEALDSGDLVLSEKTRANLGINVTQGMLNLPAVILAQVPEESRAEFASTARVAMKLSDETMAEPPGLAPGKPVAYIARDGDLIHGLVRAAPVELVLLDDKSQLGAARAEIQQYLDEHDGTASSSGVRATVMTVDDYFPPIISLEDLWRWQWSLRIGLALVMVAIGIVVGWLRLRMIASEIALFRALGDVRYTAFLRAHKRLFLGSGLSAILVAVPFWINALLRQDVVFPLVTATTLVLSWFLILLCTLVVSLSSLRNSPIQELSRVR